MVVITTNCGGHTSREVSADKHNNVGVSITSTLQSIPVLVSTSVLHDYGYYYCLASQIPGIPTRSDCVVGTCLVVTHIDRGQGVCCWWRRRLESLCAAMSVSLDQISGSLWPIFRFIIRSWRKICATQSTATTNHHVTSIRQQQEQQQP